METSDLLSGPQELLLPREEEGGREGQLGKKRRFSGKKIGCQETKVRGRTPLNCELGRLLGAFCCHLFLLLVTLRS